ncbi:hypothetical protein [Halococcus saccharolyticus]|uniref:EF-hand domain-containing protein n=1 Tax=Halococcus saccharolyticus DSM 5350 TaxID=1227455 RepID=M0MA87_9EURY|nr:hypothetical protein [Halococcus saccharolyticus]EMA42661.1 hypothetical protein C449_16003 [Halococcus saccharolyticus DSM 5350]
MPTTSSGETVYANPDELTSYIQTDPQSLGLSTTADEDGDGTTDWQDFLEKLQSKAKGRIDDYCRRDFELHEGETVTLDGERGTSVLSLPSPVRDVQEVRIDGSSIDTDSWHVKPASGSLVRTGGRASPVRAGPSDYPATSGAVGRHSAAARNHVAEAEWPPGYGNIEVDLDHGYQTPPPAVREAEMKLVDHTVVGMAQKREGMVVQADSFEMAVNIPVAWNAEIRGMLKSHREVGVGN